MRIVITLDPDERTALGAMARCELRDPRDQIRYILRAEAQRRGLLAAPIQEKDAPRHDPDARRAA